MNDTHRSTPSFGKLIDATRHAFRMPARPEQVGRLTPEVRDALNTQTTLPNSAASVESVVTRRRLIATLTCEQDASRLDAVIVNGREFVPAIQASESGKSGDGAPIDEFAGGYAFAARNDAVRAENQDASAREVFARVSDRIEASLERFGKACREAFATDATERAHYAAVGMMTEEGEDGPTPEAQAEAFQAITAEPRPSAVAIKAALERGDEIIRKVLRWTPYNDELRYVPTPTECGTIGFDLRAMLGMLDRLGIHCLALEIERDDLAAQLDRIADQAKPIDGTDLAELVQRARRWSEAVADYADQRGARDIIDRLVAAVNDQGRRLREAEEATPIHICGCDGQSANPDDVIAESYRVISELIRHNTDPGASKWSNLVSRMRWAMIQEQRALTEARGLIDESRPVVQWVHDIAGMTEIDIDLGDLGAIVATARGTFQDPPRQVRHYGADQLNDAMRALHARWSPGQLSGAPIREIVELVAQYLGLVRATGH